MRHGTFCFRRLFFLICAAALDVLSFPQIGTTSGGEREQEDFVSMCGPSDLWKCFGRDQVRCKRLFFRLALDFGFLLAVNFGSQSWNAEWDASVRAKLRSYSAMSAV
jgi:hypothetical protein